MFKGIDVSHHNGVIDWHRVKAAGVDFAMLRACYGWDNDSQIDRQLQNNIQGCEAAGVPYGLYHYSYAKNPEEAKKEAAFFLRIIQGAKPLYPVAFDFEEKSQLALPLEMQLAIIEAFLGEIKAAGYYGMLYMSASPMERLRKFAPERVERFDCWVAHININKPAFSGKYGLWQYSWHGQIDGIKGDVDINKTYEDYPAIIKAAGKNGWKQEETSKPPAETVSRAEYAALLAERAALQERYDLLRQNIQELTGELETLVEQVKMSTQI